MMYKACYNKRRQTDTRDGMSLEDVQQKVRHFLKLMLPFLKCFLVLLFLKCLKFIVTILCAHPL